MGASTLIFLLVSLGVFDPISNSEPVPEKAVSSDMEMQVTAELIRREIMDHMVDPCYRECIEATGLNKKISMEDAMALLKMLAVESTETYIESTTKLVAHMDSFESRMAIYELGRSTCVDGIMKELRSQGVLK